jgi:hypothetical protein
MGVQVVTTCGAASLTNNAVAYVAMNAQGSLCTNAAGSATANQGNAGTNAQAWWVRIGDATNGPVAVKPASTAAVATDPSLTVQLNPLSPGVIALGQATKANSVPVTFASDQDPCSYAKKSSVAISITSATTTSLVAVSGSTTVYVCGYSLALAGSATTANSIKFEYGTGAACTSPTDLTGAYGSNDAAVSTTPTQIDYGNGAGTIITAPASNGVCAVTLGNAVFAKGVLTYVQQ